MKNSILFVLALCTAFCTSAQTYIITTFAGPGTGALGNGGPATAATVGIPNTIVTDTLGNVYFSGIASGSIRKINTSGVINSFAGTGTMGYSGNGGPATAAQFDLITGLAADRSGNVFVSEAVDYTWDRYTIRKIDAAGIITLFAGIPGSVGFSGDGGPASAASFNGVGKMGTDDMGNLYVLDKGNHRIRKINPSGTITTVVGNGTTTYAGDGSPATATGFDVVSTFAVDPSGNIYIACPARNIIYKVNTSGVINSFAGDGIPPPPVGPFISSGDGGPAINAKFLWINGIAADRQGNVFVLDPDRLRIINPAGIIKTIAGFGYGGYSGDNGIARYAMMNAPIEIHVDNSGIIYIGENNNRIMRKLRFVNMEPTLEAGAFASLASCTPGSTFALDTLLRVNDADSADTLVWSAITAPTHGSLTASFTAGTYTGTVYPSGLSYTADAGYTGADSFLVSVYDGYESDTITIRVTTVGATSGIIASAPACVGYTTNLSFSAPGGTWSSAATSIATIGSSTGVLTSVSAGTATITYTVYPGCYTTTVVTVNSTPDAITGTMGICEGATTNLYCTPAGGTWSTLDTYAASVNSSGLVTGLSSGMPTISYTNAAGCLSTAMVEVYPVPAAITGMLSVCVDNTTLLENTLYGGTWSSSTPSVGTIDATSGWVTGISAGTTEITYTSGYGGCYITAVLTVNETPVVAAGPHSVCEGAAITLTATPGGGTWTSYDPTIATIDASGVVTGVNDGIGYIAYSSPAGCWAWDMVTVNATPDASIGVPTVCYGSTTYLYNATWGGTWTSSNVTVATVDTFGGTITGVSAGTANISYTTAAGCFTTTEVTVNAALVRIMGPSTVCVGATATAWHALAGGTWSSSDVAIGTIDASGNFTGISAGTFQITYTMPTGCFKTRAIIVSALPAAITGSTSVCMGSSITLYSDAGNSWSSSSMRRASVDASGNVTGHSAGTVTITTTNGSGCIQTTVITVLSLPSIPGPLDICQGATTTLSCPGFSGGTWTSSNTSVATIGSATGAITGVALGTSVISYTATNSCSTSNVANVITTPPLVSIVGTVTMAVGSTQTLTTSVPGGTWTSSNTSVATINATSGFMTAVSGGLLAISYTLTNACGTTVSKRKFSVLSFRPAAPAEIQAESFSMYPNPTSGVLNITVTVPGRLSVMSIDGREVMSYSVEKGNNRFTLPDGLSAGTYMCRFAGDDNAVRSVKLEVVR